MTAANGERGRDVEYKVVLNDEQQYSIWPADKENAPGWHDAGVCGPKDECLAHVRRSWRPRQSEPA